MYQYRLNMNDYDNIVIFSYHVQLYELKCYKMNEQLFQVCRKCNKKKIIESKHAYFWELLLSPETH